MSGVRFALPHPRNRPARNRAEPLAEPQLADEAEEPLADEVAMEPPVLAGRRTDHASAEPFEFLQVFDEPAYTGHALAGRGPAGSVPLAGRPLAAAAGAGTGAAHPLAALFAELWAARDEGSRVEVHLESGSLVTPDGYLKSHSMQDYAVLVAKDPDGRSTVTIVPWNSIARIILRALKEVPGEVVR